MNFINRFQNAQDLSVSLGNRFTEDHLMHIFLDKFYLGGRYTPHIASHQADLIREETFIDQKYLSISSLHTGYLNLDNSSGSGKKNQIKILVKKQLIFVEVLTNPQRNV